MGGPCFLVLRSALRALRSAFRIPHSALRAPRSAFRLSRSALRIPRFALLLAALLGLGGCSERPVVVGAVLPLTGEHAVYGKSLRQGIEVAEDQVNRAGGVAGRPLDVAFRDTGSSAQAAAEDLKGLIHQEKVSAVIGGATSGEALAMAPMAESYHRILISPSASSPQLTGSGEFVFRVWPSDLLEASTSADFAAYTLRALRVLVVSSESTYSDGVRSAFADRFAGPQRRVDTLVARNGDRRWDDLASQARGRAGQAHCLYVVGYENDLVAAIRALRKAGIDLPILTVSAASNLGFPQQLGAEAEGVLVPRPRYDPSSSDEPVRGFVAAYRKRFGSEPDIYAAHAFDAMMVLATVMSDQGTRPESIQRGLHALRNFPGASGPITFDPKGDVVQPIQICVILEGKLRPLAEVQDEVLPPIQRKVESLRFGRH
jgi:branched-chain amino acid transport system substrate-binding protein